MDRRPAPTLPVDLPIFASEETRIDFAHYWRVLRKHLWGIMGLAFAVGLIATLFAYSLEPVYEAKTSLLVDTKRKGFSPVKQEAGMSWMSYFDSQTYLETQILLLQSRNLAKKVAERLELSKHPEYDPRQQRPRRARFQLDLGQWLPRFLRPEGASAPDISDERALEAAVSAVQGGVTAEALEDSEIVMLSFRSHDPELAARIANAYAEAYIEMGLETRLQTVQKAASWLTQRMEGLREQVDESEVKLQEYREAHGIVDMSGAIDLTDKELEGLSGRLVEARARRAELENLADQMRRLGSLSDVELASHSAVLSNPIIQSLKTTEVEAERKVSELSKRYGPKHPKMIAAESDLRTVQGKLSAEIANAVAGVTKELEIARSKEQQLSEEFAALKTNAQTINRKEFNLGALEREVETNRQLYDMFLTRFKETDLGTDVESTNARVVDPARVPGGAIAPRKDRIVAIAVVVALLLAIGLAFLVEHLDNTLKSGEEAEDRLGIPFLGVLPLLKGRAIKNTSPERMMMDNPRSEFSEAIRTIRTGVVLSGLDDPHRVVLVTSTVPTEGKTTLATNLATALGQLEKVLLIDADLRRASIGSKLGFAGDLPGLSDLVARKASPEECIHRVEIKEHSIDVLPAGMIPPNPLELLSSKRFAETLEQLGERYDRIVVDSAPAQAVSDAMVLSKMCNAVVYVVKADSTPTPLAQVGVKRLKQVDAPLIGVILNYQDTAKAARYGYYGKYRRYAYAYDGYSEYYGRGKSGS